MFNAKLFTRLIPVFAGITMLVASCDKNNVTAEPEVHHFTISMSDITLSSGVLTITKDDPDTPFYYAIVKKSSLEALGENFQAQANAYFKGEYEFYLNDFGLTHEQAIAEMLHAEDIKDKELSWFTAAVDYVVIAAYSDDTPEAIGDFESYEFSTLAPEPADVTFEITVTELQKRQVSYTITPSNDEDTYSFAVVKCDDYKGMTDDEILADLLPLHSYIMYNGQYSGTEDLYAGTEYMLAVYGSAYGAATTKLYKKVFTTPDAGDPSKWTFEASFEGGDIKGYQLNATVIPSNDAIDYFYELVPDSYTAERFLKEYKANMDYMIEVSGITKELYVQWYSVYGTDETLFNVVPGQGYKIAAIAVDSKTLDFATGVMFSDVITPAVPEDSDAAIEVIWDKYYDGDSIYEYNNGYSYVRDRAVFPISIKHDGAQMRYGVFIDDGKEYSKQELVYTLLEKGSAWVQDCFAPFGKDGVVYAVSIDNNGLCGPVFSKKFNFSKSGAASGEEYFKDKGYDVTAAASEVKTESAAPSSGFARRVRQDKPMPEAFTKPAENPYRR